MIQLTVHRATLEASVDTPDLGYLLGEFGYMTHFEPVRLVDYPTARDWCYVSEIRDVAPDRETIRIGVVSDRELADYWDRDDLDVIIFRGNAYGPVKKGKCPTSEGALIDAAIRNGR